MQYCDWLREISCESMWDNLKGVKDRKMFSLRWNEFLEFNHCKTRLAFGALSSSCFRKEAIQSRKHFS